MKKDAKWVAKVLNQIGYEVTLNSNFSNPKIDEIISEKGWTLSYLPEKEKNWAGLNNDGWGWGITNDEDGYLVNEKSYKDDLIDAMTDFMVVLTLGEKGIEK